jgi:putative transposon-encoded protein
MNIGIMLGGIMPKKTENQETTKEETKEAPARKAVQPQQPAVQQQPQPTAFQYIRQLGYGSYSFAKEYEVMDLETDPRPYVVAKKVNVLAIREENGTSPYVGLAFVGVLDDPLFFITMERNALEASVSKQRKTLQDTVGLEFHGVSRRFGNVALVAMPKSAYQEFVTVLESKP